MESYIAHKTCSLLFQGEITKLGHTKKELKRDLEQLKDQFEQQREHKMEQERRVG